LSEFEDALGSYDQARLKEYLEEVDWRRVGCCDSIYQLVYSQLLYCDEATILISGHGGLSGGGAS
jgi:hypothetical protein